MDDFIYTLYKRCTLTRFTSTIMILFIHCPHLLQTSSDTFDEEFDTSFVSV